jgi:hypothetical protein
VRARLRHCAVTLLAVSAAASIAGVLAGDGRAFAQTSDKAIFNDPVARLGRQLESGEVSLEFRPGSGYLQSLLDRLEVKVDSQLLVFSKTSFQPQFISPKTPRAVFFNDRVAVGSVQGGDVLELMSLDPARGFIFYTLGARRSEAPRFVQRGAECAFCHLPGNHGAAGLIVASVTPDPQGTPFFTGSFIGTTDQRTPFADRWGGWYVTGTHGSQKHMGNAVAPDPDRPGDLDQSHSQNVTTLQDRVDLAPYLTSTSDIVALMTLAHQAGVTNRILGVSRQYERNQRGWESESAARALDETIDDLVGHMLTVDEEPLRDPIAGVSTFTTTFPAQGPRDHLGRSLRDFDLKTRLFRYRLSYMIYSEAFDAMPAGLQARVYQRLYDVLTGKDVRKRFAGLSAADRRTTLEILLETKPTLPPYWKSSPTGH